MNNEKVACALLMNDMHISKDSIVEFVKNWNEAVDVCEKYNIEDIFIGGDLWQSRSSQTLDVLLAVRSCIMATTKKGIRIVIANGNHDKVNQDDDFGYSHIFSEYENVEVIDECEWFRLSDHVELCIVGYYPENGKFLDVMKKDCMRASSDPNIIEILYIHEGVQGALGGLALDTEVPNEVFEEYDKILVGHYHNRCKIKGTNIEYIGASRQHNFGEDEEKGYTIIYTDGTTEFIKNNVNTRYAVVECEYTKATMDTIIDRLDDYKKNKSNYKVKLKLNCSEAQSKTIDKQKLFDAGASKIDIVTDINEIKPIDEKSLDVKFDKNGIQEAYKTFCKDKNVENVDMGLMYLNKIKEHYVESN